MFGNTFGRIFRVTTAGESYSGAYRQSADISHDLKGGLITIVDGVPAGLKLNAELIQVQLDKRRPGRTELDTPRKEEDKVYVLTGVMKDDYTTGAPVTLYIPNAELKAEHVEKHEGFAGKIRPGQATITYFQKYGNKMDWLGAGRASGRETAARVAAGAVAGVVLQKLNIDVIGFVKAVKDITAGEISYEMAKKNYRQNEINCPDLIKAKEMIECIRALKEKGDSCGGIVEVIVRGVPPGLGEPVFDKIDAVIAHAMMSIGSVKGVEIGAGFEIAKMAGSEANDIPYLDKDGETVLFKTNKAGGILGGISNGDELRVRVAVKPTPTISIEQDTIDMYAKKNVKCKFDTRNDACICTRIYPVCEAMIKIVILDFMYMTFGYDAISEMVGENV